ncbi:unnamed protein product [Heligmosomoides polygyrus]|uniref:Cellulase n=1 Tax=Heligmosomoides polygyrus TaxID=6339 RepID=A0A183FEE7_HELPZ|nr:unnamed protein product [Heligmosomoides polygyrus]
MITGGTRYDRYQSDIVSNEGRPMYTPDKNTASQALIWLACNTSDASHVSQLPPAHRHRVLLPTPADTPKTSNSKSSLLLTPVDTSE